MPNWCYNILTVSGDTEQLKDFVTKSLVEEDDKQAFTFNGTVPLPEELVRIEIGSNSHNAEIFINATERNDWSGVNEKLTLPNWIKFAGIEEGLGASDSEKRHQMLNYIKTQTTEELLEQARKIPEYLRIFGAENWYDWSCINWGTKWDACEPTVLNNDYLGFQVNFDTAWSPPIPWVMKCEELYPKLSFTLEYEEGGMCFKGVYQNGVDTEFEFEHYEEDDEELPVSNTN